MDGSQVRSRLCGREYIGVLWKDQGQWQILGGEK